MEDEQEQFSVSLRRYRQHVLFAWLGVAGAILGYLLRQEGLPVDPHWAALLFVTSAINAWKGGWAMNIRPADHGEGSSTVTTRDWEDMSPVRRVQHVQRAAILLVMVVGFLVVLSLQRLALRNPNVVSLGPLDKAPHRA